MARRPSRLLTDRESQIMHVLWQQGPSTAEAIRLALPDRPHDSTVRTLLRVLKQKGYVRVRGRQPATYESKVTRTQVQTKAARNLLQRFFGGSVEALVTRLVDDEELSFAQLEQIRKTLSQRKRKGGQS
jgi:BlaI family transcriptional regulator, penicillinase repressor